MPLEKANLSVLFIWLQAFDKTMDEISWDNLVSATNKAQVKTKI